MIIELIEEGPYAEYSIDGTVLSIGDLEIDLNQRQEDSQVIIDITYDGENFVEGLSKMYAINIMLPPREYEQIETNQTDENGNPIIEARPLPLDMDKVVLKLWQFKPITKNEGGIS